MNNGLIMNGWLKKIAAYATLCAAGLLLVGCAARGIEVQKQGDLATQAPGDCYRCGVKVQEQGQAAVQVTAETEPQLPDGGISYAIAPLDVLQVDVYPKRSALKLHKAEYANEIRLEFYFVDKSYRIAPGDILGIELAGESDKVYDVAILPDGSMHLPRVGRVVSAFGKTPLELTVILNREYAVLLRNPQVRIGVNRSGLEQLQRLSNNYMVDSDGQIVMPLLGAFKLVGLDAAQIRAAVAERAKEYFHNNIEVVASILPASRRQVADSRTAVDGPQYFHGTVKVAPDGSVFVPDAGIFATQGKTLDELNREMQLAFDRAYQNDVQVRVALQESPNLSVFIGGEIHTPGKYPHQASLTLLQLISAAGWVNDTADISRVVVLHSAADDRYTRYQTNLMEVVSGSARLKQDIKLSPRDIVIIPKSGIANLDLWVDQYIRRVLPFNTSVNYTVTKQGSAATLVP